MLFVPSVRADEPTLVGKVAEDGTLMALWHKNFLGEFQSVEELDIIEDNLLWVSVYNPLGNGTTDITIHQYRVRTRIIERQVGNETIREEVEERFDHDWSNVSVRTPQRRVSTVQIDIPASKEERHLEVSYLNIGWKMRHKTLATMFLLEDFTLGNLIFFALIVMLITGAVWGVGTATASGILKRVNYVPHITIAGLLLYIIPIIGVGAFLIYSAFYSEVAGLSWYVWEIPMFIIATAVMLQYLPKRARRWMFLQAARDEMRTNELTTPLREIVVAKDGEGNDYLVHPTSWRQVIYRLFGKKPKVEFEVGVKPWYGKNTLAKRHPRDPHRVYYLDHDADPEIDFPKLKWKRKWIIPYLGLTDGKCKIPLSGAHGRPVMAFLSNVISLEAVAKSRDKMMIENVDLHAKVLTGEITKGRDTLFTALRRMQKEADPERYSPSKELKERGEKKPEKGETTT
jgi:hypothetical protein